MAAQKQSPTLLATPPTEPHPTEEEQEHLHPKHQKGQET
jgi:hypothetical protein